RPIAFQGHGLATLSDNRFKLLHNPNDKRLRSDNSTAPMAEWELYDLLADPSESNNLADQCPEVLKKMKSQLIAWQISCEASNKELDY
ncbi:MAG: hypothetical protein P8L44_19835, partial [Opitutales bacterium]|nr:hypothetical protein [Opitutales bacterium]